MVKYSWFFGWFFHFNCLPEEKALTALAGKKPEGMDDDKWERHLNATVRAELTRRYPIHATGICTHCLQDKFQ